MFRHLGYERVYWPLFKLADTGGVFKISDQGGFKIAIRRSGVDRHIYISVS